MIPTPLSPLAEFVERLRAGPAVERPAKARGVSHLSRPTAAGGLRLRPCEHRLQLRRVARAARSERVGRATDPRLCSFRAPWTGAPRPPVPRSRGSRLPRRLRVGSNAAFTENRFEENRRRNKSGRTGV